MDKKEFAAIRRDLAKSQSQLARILCVSEKAIQSFEQGWRNIPTYIEREMMLLRALATASEGEREPHSCWEVMDCPDEWRQKCIVGELKIRHFCWYINGTYCQGKYRGTWNQKIQVCRDCLVYKSAFQ